MSETEIANLLAAASNHIELLVTHIREHNSDYGHVTPPEVIDAARAFAKQLRTTIRTATEPA